MGNLLFNFIFMNEQNIIRMGKLFSKLYTHTHKMKFGMWLIKRLLSKES